MVVKQIVVKQEQNKKLFYVYITVAFLQEHSHHQ